MKIDKKEDGQHTPVDTETEAKIKEAVKNGSIVMAESGEIEEYEEESRRILQLFDIDLDECFISDQSSFGDFNGCGEAYMGTSTDEWVAWIQEKVWIRFAIKVDYNTLILDACKMARSSAAYIGSGLN